MINKHLYRWLLILASTYLSGGCAFPGTVGITVVDTRGAAIPDARVYLVSGYSPPSFDVSGKSGPAPFNQVTSDVGTTDENGNYSFFGLISSSTSIVVRKIGFYETRFYPGEQTNVTIPLRRVGNPVDVISKRIFRNLPEGDGVFGFDVLAGDLVRPYGRGTQADFEFRVSTYMKQWGEKEFKRQRGEFIAPRDGDGFIPFYTYDVSNPRSEFSRPFVAPENGYIGSIRESREAAISEHGSPPDIWYWIDDYEVRRPDIVYESFFFKVRTNQPEGPIYGMITSPIRLDNRNTDSPYVSFSYFINPDHTPNLEAR